jgi:GntR family transcriptional regulator/MocR family aminotransferase
VSSDLHLDLDAATGRSLRARAEWALREAVRSGRLAPGTRLPPTRTLAGQLGVSRGVLVDAYAQLAAEGYLHTRRGGGTTVARAPSTAAEPEPDPDPGRPSATTTAPAIRHDLRPTLPAVDVFPRAAWASALTRVVRTVPDERLGYAHPLGEPEWRATLAAWLGRRRGVRAAPAQVGATGSVRFGLPLVWDLLGARGVRRVGIEAPGWPRIAESLAAAGLEAVPLPVDGGGIDPADVIRHRLDAVAVTPAHQFPTGAVLASARRTALVSWAREQGAWLLEDDYDAEYRYDRQPVGSLQGLAPDVVLYAGSASKILAPALRLGWLVLPAALAADLEGRDPWPLTGTPPPLDQLALDDLVVRGEVDRHLRRQRTRYRRRRDALLDALGAALPTCPIEGAAAGLFLVLRLPAVADEEAIVAAAAGRGLPLEGLRTPGRPGLTIGYANLPEAAAPAAAAELAAAVRSAD